jgi:hypothetical protein
MARRTAFKPEDQRLLERFRGQHWTVDELRWVLTHLDPEAPTLVMQEVHAKQILLSAQTRDPRHSTLEGPVEVGEAP